MKKVKTLASLFLILGLLGACESEETGPMDLDDEIEDSFLSKFSTQKNGATVNWEQGYFNTSSSTKWEIFATTQPTTVTSAEHDYLIISLYKENFLTEGTHELERDLEEITYYTKRNDTYNSCYECEVHDATVVVTKVDEDAESISGTYEATLCGSIIPEMTVSGTFTDLEYK